MRGALSTPRLQHRSSPIQLRCYKMEKLLKFTEQYYHLPLVCPQFLEFEDTQSILKTDKKQKSAVSPP